MQELTTKGLERIEEVARRHGTSTEAAMTLLRALIAGGGTMAQFNHPDLGGMGQWSQGGMIMVGDMFNTTLRAKVDGLCRELAGLLTDRSDWRAGDQPAGTTDKTSLFVAAGSGRFADWWGEELGAPASTGSQNATRYAYFPTSRRLAIESGGKVMLYDTGDHQIGGASQQQSGDAGLTFTSQHGLVRIGDLRVIPGGAAGSAPEDTDHAAPADPTPGIEPAKVTSRTAPELPGGAAEAEQSSDIILLIERLAGLREKNILSEEEFTAKKAELLARL